MIWFLNSEPLQKNQDCAVPLGVQGENEAKTYTADVSDWLTAHPLGVIALVLQAPDGSAPYMGDTRTEDGVVYWNVTSFDTAQVGYGKGELRLVDSGAVLKSYTFRTYTKPSVLMCASVPPAPVPEWATELLDAASGINIYVDQAESAAQDAAQSAASAANTLAEVVAAGESAVHDIQTEEATQEAAIEAAGAEQIAAVGTAGTAQIDAIEAKGEEVISKIPEDFPYVADLTENMMLTKLDAVGTYSKLALEKSDGMWDFKTNSAVPYEGRKYIRYEIPTGTKIIGVRGYQINADKAAFGFYDSGNELIYASKYPNGTDMASATPIGVPTGATVLYVNVGSGDLRGVWSFDEVDIKSSLELALKMSNVPCNSLVQLIAQMPEIGETPTKADFDNAKTGLAYLVGFTPTVSDFPNILHMPVRSSGVLLTLSRSATYDMGKSQTYYATTGGTFTRVMMGGTWRQWRQLSPSVYNVGPTRTYKTLTDLLPRIQTDTEEKIIYIDDGVYDVFNEYVTYFDGTPGKERPTDDTPVDGYFDYCLFLPMNTKLIGVGNVVLEWLPTASEITVPESTTWSVLNLWYGNNLVENIQIHCKNCRYGIHDDSHNTYTGFKNRFVNVTINQEANDSGLGFGSVTGFGFEDRSTYEFENCTFTAPNNVSGLYGHDGELGGAVIIVRGCVINCGSSSNKTAVRFQTIRADDSNPIRVFMSGCYINGGVNLDQRRETSGQMFDVTLLHCGNPEQTVEVEDNPYPIKVYDYPFTPDTATTTEVINYLDIEEV